MGSKSYQVTKRLTEIPFLIQIVTFFKIWRVHCLMGWENHLQRSLRKTTHKRSTFECSYPLCNLITLGILINLHLTGKSRLNCEFQFVTKLRKRLAKMFREMDTCLIQ